jgi:hypothetical protein
MLQKILLQRVNQNLAPFLKKFSQNMLSGESCPWEEPRVKEGPGQMPF